MAFATTTELATSLGRTFTATETAMAASALEDATAYLRDQIGQQVSAGTSTVTVSVADGGAWVRLPQQPVRQVTQVLLDGVAVTDWVLVSGALYREGGWAGVDRHAQVTVTYAHGLAMIPPVLGTWCRVLAAGVLAQAARGSLSAAGISSERIDDYAVNYDGSHALALPERVLDRLRASFGGGAHVTRIAR